MLDKDLSDEEKLISLLKNFGLSPIEAQVYIGLVKTGPSKASQISNFARINRITGYKLLDNLKELGFVSSTFSNPRIYTANDLKSSLQYVTSRKKFELERLEKLVPLLSETYEKIKSNQAPQPEPKTEGDAQFNIISGRYNIYLHIAKLIKKEKRLIYLIASTNDLGMMYYTSIPEYILEAQKRGIEIKCVTELDGKEDDEFIKRLKIENIRIANLPSKGRIVCGESESLVSGYTATESGLNSEHDTALVTNSEEFVRSMRCLCRQLWESGKELRLIKQKGESN